MKLVEEPIVGGAERDGARLWLSGAQWKATLAKLDHVSKALGWVRVSLVHYAGVEHLTTTLHALQGCGVRIPEAVARAIRDVDARR